MRTFSPSLVNDLRLSYRRIIQDFPLKDPAFNAFPNLSARDFNINLGPQSNLPQGQFSNNYQIYDTVNYVRGATITTNVAECRPGSGAAVAYFAINPNAEYIQAGLGARTTAGRNTLRSNGFNRTDSAFMKDSLVKIDIESRLVQKSTISSIKGSARLETLPTRWELPRRQACHQQISPSRMCRVRSSTTTASVISLAVQFSSGLS